MTRNNVAQSFLKEIRAGGKNGFYMMLPRSDKWHEKSLENGRGGEGERERRKYVYHKPFLMNITVPRCESQLVI